MSILERAYRKAPVGYLQDMIIFSYPKVGKTSLTNQLPGNYICLDFDKGARYYDGNFIEIDSPKTLMEVQKELKALDKPLDFLVVDTLTSLYEDFCNTLAIAQYNKENSKKLEYNEDITKLAYGLGQKYMRKAFQDVLNMFKKYCNTLICYGHVADKAMDGSDSSELSAKELAIDGKLKHIVTLKTDALGLLYRADEVTNVLSFETTANTIGGTRVPHLANKSFEISKRDEKTGEVVVNWEQIFPHMY